MKGYLLDTNILSELRKPKANHKVVNFIANQPLESLHVSSVTFAEIRFGIEKVENPAPRAELSGWLQHELRPLFEERIVELNEDILLRWRIIIEQGRKQGYTFSHPDVLIAATAAHCDLMVVSRNSKEFLAAGLDVINPWKSSKPISH